MSSQPGSMATETFTRWRRIEGLARLLPQVGQPAGLADAAGRVCDVVRVLLGSGAAALYLESPDGPTLGAARGFASAPPAPPASFASAAFDELRARTAGLVELAPLRSGGRVFGLLLLAGGEVEPFNDGELGLVGDAAAVAIENARAMEEMRLAHEQRERAQDQMLRTERLRVLGEMALGIAHEFNNVLNAMLGQVGVLEILADRHPTLLPPIERLRQVALDGARTVSRLQDFSRQRRDQEFAAVDVSAILGGLVGRLREGANALRVEESIEPRVLVAGEMAELRDALTAVLDNVVEAGARHLYLEVAREDGEARVVIADDGCGMTRDVRKRAFDPFFTTKGSGATGLGLSVAYGIVRRHGGRIDLESVPGQGTRVRIRIPALEPSVTDHPPVKTGMPVSATGLRVLLIEDDGDNREAMSALLGLGGHLTTAAATGREGVRRFSPGDFDLVLTDLGLPDMTGWDVASQVKHASSSTPVALITGWGLNLAQDEIRRRGVDLLIKKPIEPRRFLEQVAGLASSSGSSAAAAAGDAHP